MALEPIDYTSHSREIEEAYLSVVRGTDPDTTWVILSPNDKKEYAPEFTGSEFTEFLEGFSDTKVQFGLARVCPPGSDVEKLILIGWCPDSAPLKTRASFASNFGVIANQVLKGYHVQVTARDEDDLDEKELLMKISNAAGARYSIQQQPSKTTSAAKPRPASVPSPAAKPAPKSVPTPAVKEERTPTSSAAAPKPAAIASPAKKPSAVSRAPQDDDDEWDEPELEERDFDSKPLQPNKSTYQPIGKVDLQKVIAEENARDDPRLVNQVKAESFAKINPQDDIENLRKESRAKRDAELDKFMGTKPPVAALPKKNDDMVIKGFQNEKTPAQLWAERKQKAAIDTPKVEAENKKDATFEDDEEEDHEVTNIKAKFEKLASDEPSIIQPKKVNAPAKVTEETSAPVKKMPIGQPLPGMHMEVEDEERPASDDDWDDDEDETPSTDLKPPALAEGPQKSAASPSQFDKISQGQTEEEEEEQPPLPSRRETAPAEEVEDEEEEPAPALPSRSKESSLPPPPPPRRATPPAEEPTLPSAIAEYDYEAGEDNELTFAEGDKIVNIDFVDEDWWLGELEKNGEKGLFPSNYVELVQ